MKTTPSITIAHKSILFSGIFLMFALISDAKAQCAADPNWFPQTPAPSFNNPPPHPAPDCGFYQPAWQTFLFVTKNGINAQPAFLSFPTISSVFDSKISLVDKPQILSLSPRSLKGSNDPSSDIKPRGAIMDPAFINAGARQAGRNGLLVDSNGYPVFYSIHFDNTFEKFLKDNNLTTKTGIKAADPELEFPKGAIELKAAWKIVEGTTLPSDYITTKATVPYLKVNGNVIDIDKSRKPREVNVALLSIHVVFVLEGHPEFIWATFEHVDKDGNRDLAPSATQLPSQDNGLPDGKDGIVSTSNFVLYKANTLASAAASGALPNDSQLIKLFDNKQQKFLSEGNPFQTSIYRIFPGSKTFETDEDKEIVEINTSINQLHTNYPSDSRLNYRLVGAVWLDNPKKDFKSGIKLKNPDGVKSDDLGAMVAGEEGLSSMAMESFTQDSFVNCFSCHDTRAIKNLAGDKVLIDKKKLNVSHVMSTFVSEAP